MCCDSRGRFYLLEKIIRIDVSHAVVCRVIVRIAFAIMVILDLYSSCYPLLTEGSLITSSTTGNNFWHQTELIGIDYLA